MIFGNYLQFFSSPPQGLKSQQIVFHQGKFLEPPSQPSRSVSSALSCLRFESNILPITVFDCKEHLGYNNYWVDQKVHSGFSIPSYGKTGVNFLANPIFKNFNLGEGSSNKFIMFSPLWNTDCVISFSFSLSLFGIYRKLNNNELETIPNLGPVTANITLLSL